MKLQLQFNDRYIKEDIKSGQKQDRRNPGKILKLHNIWPDHQGKKA
jgi:hypothetical protein